MNKELIDILEEFNVKMTKFVEDYKNSQIDQALTEAFDEPKKWEPEGGEWRVGATRVFDVEKGDEARDSLGRNYETLSQADEAALFQRRAMRFFRWCVENDPEFKDGGLASFRWLLRTPLHVFQELKELEDRGEVEF